MEEKKKKIIMYLCLKLKVCLSVGIAKLVFKIHALAKNTSAMRNMHEIFWKAGIPHRREYIPMGTPPVGNTGNIYALRM